MANSSIEIPVTSSFESLGGKSSIGSQKENITLSKSVREFQFLDVETYYDSRYWPMIIPTARLDVNRIHSYVLPDDRLVRVQITDDTHVDVWTHGDTLSVYIFGVMK